MSRRYLNDDGNLALGDSDYGQEPNGAWCVRPPGQHAGGIGQHTVEEHADGTITVTPSIVLHDEDGNELWHGYLTKGVWRAL